jgi:MucB/RseB N-terminal domain
VTHLRAPGWRVASLAAMVGVLGSGIAALTLADGPAGSAGASGQSLVDRASGPARPAVPLTAASSGGLRLLQQAVTACQDTPYHGVQVVLWWGQGDPTMSVVDVWHQPGQATLVREAPATAAPGATAPDGAPLNDTGPGHTGLGDTDPGGTDPGGTGPGGTGPGAALGAPGPDGAGPDHTGQSADAGSGSTGQSPSASYPDMDGILGVSPQLLALLRVNYHVVFAGRGSAAGHAALVVEARRPGGSLAARFWLDAATKLPLRREVFARDAQMISEDAFTNLELGDGGLAGLPSAAVASPAAPLRNGTLGALRAGGWPLPAQLPGNLALFAATATGTSSGQAVGLSYSDGLSVVSLFVQRGELAGLMPGWRAVALGGRTVYALDPLDQGDSSLAWSAGGFVYTLVADAPITTVDQVIAALPAGSQPGFWRRMAHGLRRMASWVNPLRN